MSMRYSPEAVNAAIRFLSRLRLHTRNETGVAISGSLQPFFTETGDIHEDVLGASLSDTEPPAVSFGGGGTAGTASSAARGDHTHDGPTNPVTAHEAASNPHPTYATDADLTAHAAASDPHTGYQRESEKGVANGYASLGADTLVPQDQLGTGTQDGTRFLRDDGSWQAVSGAATTVREVDGSPSVTAVAIEFPNGTLSEPSVGVARYTPTAAGGRYRAWTYTTFSAGEFTYVVDGSGNPVYALMDLE